MRKIERLRLEALEACNWRGHRMNRFTHYGNESAYAKCKDCGMEIGVMPNPPPNGIEIGGAACALNCGGDNQ